MAVFCAPSTSTWTKPGMQIKSILSPSRNLPAMAIAFTAWLTAPAPIAWISACLFSRTDPAIAPATEWGLEFADTFSMFDMFSPRLDHKPVSYTHLRAHETRHD